MYKGLQHLGFCNSNIGAGSAVHSIYYNPYKMILILDSSLIITLLGYLSSAEAVSAPPLAVVNVAEVIPGHGLPSLASLNLTSADLFNPDFKPGSFHLLLN
jgi:hypothetical protein